MIQDKTRRRVIELRKIADRNNGVLLPEEVVKIARNPNNPLHDCFTWDNTEAAHQYRLWEARKLISVTVEYLSEVSSEPIEVFVSLKSDRENGGYRYLTDVMNVQEQREELLRNAIEDFQIFKKKYDQLVELKSVFDSMEKIKLVHYEKSIITT